MKKRSLLVIPALAASVACATPVVALDVINATSVMAAEYSGWVTINGKRYWFDKNGNMHKSEWYTTEYGNKYYVGADGVMVTGWQTIGGKRYWFNNSGQMQRNKWYTTEYGNKYYVGSDGEMYTGWNDIGDERYWFQSSGRMNVNKWFTTPYGNVYRVNEDGEMITGTDYEIGKGTYTFNDIGQMTCVSFYDVMTNNYNQRTLDYEFGYPSDAASGPLASYAALRAHGFIPNTGIELFLDYYTKSSDPSEGWSYTEGVSNPAIYECSKKYTGSATLLPSSYTSEDIKGWIRSGQTVVINVENTGQCIYGEYEEIENIHWVTVYGYDIVNGKTIFKIADPYNRIPLDIEFGPLYRWTAEELDNHIKNGGSERGVRFGWPVDYNG